jgi:hypothetical protein
MGIEFSRFKAFFEETGFAPEPHMNSGFGLGSDDI